MNESKRESDKDDEEKTKETFDLVKMFVLYTGSRYKNKSKPIFKTAQFLAISNRGVVRLGEWVQLLPTILRKA